MMEGKQVTPSEIRRKERYTALMEQGYSSYCAGHSKHWLCRGRSGKGKGGLRTPNPNHRPCQCECHNG